MSFEKCYELLYIIKVPMDKPISSYNDRMNERLITASIKLNFSFDDLRNFLLKNLHNSNITIKTLYKNRTGLILLYSYDLPNRTMDDIINTCNQLYGPNPIDNNDKYLFDLLCK